MRKRVSQLIQILGTTILLAGCASPRSSLLGVDYADQPPRVLMRWECNGRSFTTQGVGVCEQKGQSAAKVSVKIPPVEGRVIYSNGQLKDTQDFNWNELTNSVRIEKSLKTEDWSGSSGGAWTDLSLGDITATFGDWPVGIDVTGLDHDIGLMVTRGVIYHRVCDDVKIPCSKLEVEFECKGDLKKTAPGVIGKCSRMSGSSQAFRVHLSGLNYSATPGVKIYLSIPSMGINQSFTPDRSAFDVGDFRIETPNIPLGPTLVGLRLAYVSGGKTIKAETRILVVGFSPEWTGLDQPHFVDEGDHIEFVKPVMANVIEADLYQGRDLVKKDFSFGKRVSLPKPTGSQIACGFAWSRDASDQTVYCVDANFQEVNIP